MDIDRLTYFQVIAETGSLVKASEILHISQPALSKAMKILEEETGLKLFENEGRGLKLTLIGESFRNEVTPLLDSLLNLPKKILSNSKSSVLKLGSFEVFTTHFLKTLNKHLVVESLELYELIPGKLEEAISQGQVDIGITYLPVPKAGVDFIEVTKIKMGIFGLSSFKKTKLEDLPFVVPLSNFESSPNKVQGLDGWPEHKWPRNIKYRVTLMESALSLCRQGLAVAYLPQFIVDVHNQEVVSDYHLKELNSPLLEKEKKQSVFLLRNVSNSESKTYRQIARALRTLT